jgi:uncharacterized protein YcfJ
LWNLDAQGDIIVHGAAIMHRDGSGSMNVATKDTDPGLRTAIGVGLGALIGALAGPLGVAAGTAIGTAAGVGAAAGGFVGLRLTPSRPTSTSRPHTKADLSCREASPP